VRIIPAHGFSRDVGGAQDRGRDAGLFRPLNPISGQTDSRVAGPLRRKDNSSLGPRRRLRVWLRCRAKPTSSCWDLDQLPFRQGGARSAPLKRNFPMAQDRLTHVQPLFAWNPSPLWPFKFSLKYLLLPPRSAPGAVRPGLAPWASSRDPRACLLLGARILPRGGAMGGTLSAIHFQG